MTRATLTVAALLAALLFWRAPSRRQRVIAETLAGLLALDMWRPLLAPWPALYVAGFVGWYAVTSRGVVAVLAPRGPNGGQLFAVLVCASAAALTHGVTAELGRAAYALALALQLLAVARFVLRGRAPDDAQTIALMLAASSAADLVGAWWYRVPSRDWDVGRIQAVATWILIAGWEIRCLIRARPSLT